MTRKQSDSCELKKGPRESFVSRYPEEEQWELDAVTKRRMVTHRISHHHGKLFEAQLAIAVLVCLHNRLVDDLLELCVLRGIVSTPKKKTPKARRKRTFKLLPTIILSTRNSSPLEMNPSRSISYTLKATTPTWGEHGADQKGTGTRGAWRGVAYIVVSHHAPLCC